MFLVRWRGATTAASPILVNKKKKEEEDEEGEDRGAGDEKREHFSTQEHRFLEGSQSSKVCTSRKSNM